ncbi:MAG: DUF434 domain-containing protein [Planctomycetes bacterium]|nr:DUF434 domain-containing protein [Planctomycetota bacterium]
MPDKRKHRGAHPEDGVLFGPEARPVLVEAVAHLSWLLGHAYALPSALKLVGDRFQLARRQRIAVQRCACSDAALAARRAREVGPEALARGAVHIDGYNLLTTVEAALAGGVILSGRDGGYRDLASMHGTYRRVEETRPAIAAVGEVLADLGADGVMWYLDRPVSNSGRLKALLLEQGSERGWAWQADLVLNPDRLLSEVEGVVVTADSVILDRCRRWFNLARAVIAARVPHATVLELG